MAHGSCIPALSDLTKWRELVLSALHSNNENIDGLLREMQREMELFDFTRENLERRMLFDILEKLAWIALQRSDYGKKKSNDGELQNFLFAISRGIMAIAEKIRFSNERIWFGGISRLPNSLDHVEMNSIKLVSFLIITCFLGISSDSQDENRFREAEECLNRMLSPFESTNSILKCLLEQDERCLTVLLCLLELRNNNMTLLDHWHPRLLFLALCFSIGYDEKVMIDWLHSETVAIPFCLRFFKDLLGNLDEYQSICRYICIFDDYCSFSDGLANFVKTAKPSKTVKMEHEPADDDICLKIVELIGTEKRIREVRISRTNPKTLTLSLSADDDNGKVDSFQLTMDCLIRLRLKMERLNQAELEPFNLLPLIGAIERIEEKLEQVESVKSGS